MLVSDLYDALPVHRVTRRQGCMLEFRVRLDGERLEWHEVGLWPLAEFLVRGGLGQVLGDSGLGPEVELNSRVVRERQEAKRLLDPEGMGSDLKVLVQAMPSLAGEVGEVLALPSGTGPGSDAR